MLARELTILFVNYSQYMYLYDIPFYITIFFIC